MPFIRRSLFAASLLSLIACFGSSGAGGRKRSANAVAVAAQSRIGALYRVGGRSPETGFDCSGLAWWAHHQSGLSIPPTAESQFRSGKSIALDKARPGDLFFFTTVKGKISHVGVHIGEGRFIHAPGAGKRVSQASLQNRYWRQRYKGTRRYSR